MRRAQRKKWRDVARALVEIGFLILALVLLSPILIVIFVRTRIKRDESIIED
jgi:hypothetical protein